MKINNNTAIFENSARLTFHSAVTSRWPDTSDGWRGLPPAPVFLYYLTLSVQRDQVIYPAQATEQVRRLFRSLRIFTFYGLFKGGKFECFDTIDLGKRVRNYSVCMKI